MALRILITGASSGIGWTLATYFHQAGHHVIGVSRSLPKTPYHFSYVCADLGDVTHLHLAAQEVENNTDAIDVLINCAGIGVSGPIEETPINEIDRIFRVNVLGLVEWTRLMLPLLRKGDTPKIINIGSVAGTLVIPFQAFYSMTKASVSVFSEALRLELKPEHIGVVSVLPGDTKTAFTQNRIKPEIPKDSHYAERYRRSIAKMERDEISGKDPMTIVWVVKRLLKRRHLPISVTVGFEYKLFVFLKRLLPSRLVHWILFKMYG